MILADLDRELTARVADLVADGTLPPEAALTATARTWRPAPAGDSASFSTSLALELAALAGREPAGIAARLMGPLADLPAVAAARVTGRGYLTVAVTVRALGEAAGRLAAAGPAAARSAILAGTTAPGSPWPDLAAEPSWPHAWRDQAVAITGRLAAAAGASVTTTPFGEHRSSGAGPALSGQPTVAAAVAWYGVRPVRYGLARTTPGRVWKLGQLLRPSIAAGADPLYPLMQAHSSAASTLRWAAELGVSADDPAERVGDLLAVPAERALLGLLQWLPLRVASAASRQRPDVIPGYLEMVGAGWRAVRQQAPALPFGGCAAPADAAVTGARLVLADAVRSVLAAGLALIGAPVGTVDD